MTVSEKKIIESFTGLMETLSPKAKLVLLENLANSIRLESKTKEKEFFSSFGAFAPEKSAEEIFNDIKTSRKFREKNLKF